MITSASDWLRRTYSSALNVSHDTTATTFTGRLPHQAHMVRPVTSTLADLGANTVTYDAAMYSTPRHEFLGRTYY